MATQFSKDYRLIRSCILSRFISDGRGILTSSPIWVINQIFEKIGLFSRVFESDGVIWLSYNTRDRVNRSFARRIACDTIRVYTFAITPILHGGYSFGDELFASDFPEA